MTAPLKVWIIDDDQSIRWVMEKALQKADMLPQCFEGGVELLDALESDCPDVLITDVRMPGIDGLALIKRVHALYPDLPVIIMTAHSDLDSAVAAYQGGAFEYLPKPFDINEAVELVQRAARHTKGQADAATQSPITGATLIGEAPAMQEVFRAIGRLSHSNITVLITGESGTGKELVAQALHEHSPRASRPFIAINTAAIPKDLMESELFGHERGAFTGAQTQRKGRFEQADGGTLFLDEIGDMPADLQTRLLRVLADGQFYRVGGHTPMNADVRIIAATHQDLEVKVANGEFREDLFHRLNVIRVRIPPLRERPEDIALLLEHFLHRAAKDLKTEPKLLLPEVTAFLCSQTWPGNVRELENLCRWLTVMAPGQEVHLEDLPAELNATSSELKPSATAEAVESATANVEKGDWVSQLRLWSRQQLAEGQSALLDEAVPSFERCLIEVALEHSHGHKQDAAQLLGWGRNTLTRKLKELAITDTANEESTQDPSAD